MPHAVRKVRRARDARRVKPTAIAPGAAHLRGGSANRIRCQCAQEHLKGTDERPGQPLSGGFFSPLLHYSALQRMSISLPLMTETFTHRQYMHILSFKRQCIRER
jgi:hypothetical protein